MFVFGLLCYLGQSVEYIEEVSKLMSSKQHSKAIQAATDFIEKQGTIDADPLLYKLRGECKFILGQYDGAILDLSKIINSAQAKPNDQKNAYSIRGQCNLILGNVDDALNDATKSKNTTLIKAVKTCKFQIESAQASEKNKAPKEALEHYQKALKFAPLSIVHLVKAAEFALQIGSSEEFDALSRRICKIDAKNSGYILLVGRDAFEKNQLDLAEKRFKKCSATNNNCMRLLKATKKFYSTRTQLSRLIRDSKFEETTELMNQCVEITKQYSKPNSLVSHSIDFLSARILVKKRKLAEAVDILDSILKTSPNHTEAHLERGEILMELEDYDGAIVDFSAVQRIYPGNVRAKSGIEKASELREKEKRRDYYEILGVSRGCSESQLKSAYRKAIFKWHPDKFSDKTEKKNAEKRMKMINKAMDVLSDPQKRRLYDNGVDPEAPGNNGEDFNQGQQFYRGPQGGFFQQGQQFNRGPQGGFFQQGQQFNRGPQGGFFH